MQQRTLVRELTESDILARILARTGRASAARVGPGDDAAVLETSGSVVVTTDTLIEGPDFRRAWSSGYDLGWKACAVNLADVAAMGARPTALVVALGLPGDLPIADVEAMADGFREACEALAPGCAVVGGDLTQSAALTIAVTALGDTEGREPVLRSGAAAGEIVALAGEMGQAAAGLRVLFSRFCDEAGRATPLDRAELAADEDRLVAAQLRPQPPVGLGPFAARAGATAMMDVSDGLARDAGRLARASGVGLDFDAGALGPDPQAALAGGEDHALLATFPEGPLPPGFRAIGRVVAAGASDVLLDGQPHAGGSGWDPYRDWTSASA
ncbi:thiamine-phosphate kinase [Microbacterium sp. ZXX196]|uniref:thiamine-phosphate kinase n=1 Tax=Microbacterium sp. ZXX196 TaxID=2609291 RepID=UPI0012B7F876|nr:thiamine-phosphate kinase [Microbacterium sp. ZXX196]MTE24711.1 thiamine-phosphate kinase [Microbacterium sp. ZXX196]